MTVQEQNLMQDAIDEITRLRRRNEVMAAKLDTFDRLMQIFYVTPFSNTGLSQSGTEDITFKLQSSIAKAKEEAEAKGAKEAL